MPPPPPGTLVPDNAVAVLSRFVLVLGVPGWDSGMATMAVGEKAVFEVRGCGWVCVCVCVCVCVWICAASAVYLALCV